MHALSTAGRLARQRQSQIPVRVRKAPPPARVAVIGRDGYLAALVGSDADARAALRRSEAMR